MSKNKKTANVAGEQFKEVKSAGFTQGKRRVKGVNRRAGLHDKTKNLEGETRVNRRKPLALKHVRRMRKAALALSAVFVACVAVVGVGFFTKKPVEDLPDLGFSTVCFQVPADGSNPTEHTLVENVGYLNYVLQNQPYWSSEMHSQVNTIMSQRVHTYKQFYDGVLISADIAEGVSSEATQFCVADNVVLWRPAANKNFNGMNTPWSTGEAQGLTVQQFKNKRGFPPSEFSVYVLNEKTIANAQDYSVTENNEKTIAKAQDYSVTENADGTYSMTLTLNVNTGEAETSADYYYKQQMLVTGGLDEHPVIDLTTLTYTFDKDWRVLSFSIADSYSAKMGISVHCTSNTEVTFNYDEDKAQNSFYNDYFKSEYDRLKDTLTDNGGNEEEAPSAPNPLNYLAAAFGNVLSDGAIFKVDLGLDNFNMNGAVYVGLSDGELSDIRVKLGDISLFLGGDKIAYISDGNVKYKLDANTLGLPIASDEGASGGLDVNALIDQLTAGTFTVNENSAVLQSKLELFGLEINLTFDFDTTQGVSLGYVNAEIPLGNTQINARLQFGTPEDIPQLPEVLTDYTDILADGLTVDIKAKIDELELNGFAKVIMNSGNFGGINAMLGNMGVYYDYPANMLYLTDGNVKYKLSLAAISGGDANALQLFETLDINPIINQIITNLSATDGKISSSATLEIIESAIGATLGVKLAGGIEISASVNAFGQNIELWAGLSNEEVNLPDLNGYIDVLNDGITLNTAISLDEVTLNGKLFIGFNGGKFSEIRADFGEIKVYYELPANVLYISVGELKAKYSIKNTDENAFDIASVFGGSVSDTVVDLLGNLTAGLKEISTNANLSILNSVIPANLKLTLGSGIEVNADVTLFGIAVKAEIGLDMQPVPALSEEDKSAYVDVVKEGWELLEPLLGDHISMTMGGNIYYQGSAAFDIDATLEYDSGENGFPLHIDAGKEDLNAWVDSAAYLHFNLMLTSYSATVDSIYIDLYLLDANHAVTDRGITTGAYTADGNFDIYFALSRFTLNDSRFNPVKIYAPMDEILTLVSMVGAMANLDQITFNGNEELSNAIQTVSDAIDRLLISNYLPFTKDQFSSLGDSLIPQLLGGKSLGGLLNELLEKLPSGGISGGNGIDIDLAKEYIQSVTYADDCLKAVLNSSAIYKREMSEEDNLTIQITREAANGVSRITGVDVDNIYYGENNNDRVDVKFRTDYAEIEKPTSLVGYTSFDGIDTLLKAVVNSATHETPEKDTEYGLNHEYLLSGNITASIVINLGLFKPTIDVPITLNTVKINIDENTNAVSADIHLSYDAKTVIVTAIENSCNVYISVKNDMIYIKRARKDNPAQAETRIMPLKDFLGDIMNQINFIFSFGSVIADELTRIDMSESGNALNFDGNDYGTTLSEILSYYTFNEAQDGANWVAAISGTLLTKLVGMNMSDLPIRINAVKENGALEVTGLDILETNMKLVGDFITFNFNGGLTYCNPHESILTDNEGRAMYEDTTADLANGELRELGNLSWNEVLGGDSFKDICEKTDWNALLKNTGKKYLCFGENSSLEVKTLKFMHAADAENSAFEEFGARQTVIHDTANNAVYTRYSAPALAAHMQSVEGKTAVWQPEYTADGDILARTAIYDSTSKVTVISEYQINENYAETENGWTLVMPEAYMRVYLPKDKIVEVNGVKYGLKGYRLGNDAELYSFGETAYNGDGELCFVAEIDSGSELTFTALWEQVYAVTFDNGYAFEQTVYYYYGEKIAERLPALPEYRGYNGKWVYEESATVTGETLINAEYEIAVYTVSIISSQEIQGGIDGFAQNSETGNFEATFEYNSAVALNPVSAVSPAYIFDGYYENADFTGEKITRFTVSDNAVYYVKWLGKKINVTYKSDIAFGTAKADESGIYSFPTAFTYGNEGDKLRDNDKIEGKELLGWFMENADGTYGYISSADELKNRLLTSLNGVQSVNVNLWAVWYGNVVSGEVTEATHSGRVLHDWHVKGKVNSPFVGKSAEIAEKSSDVRVVMNIVYYVSQDGVSFTKDINWAMVESVNNDGSFEKTVRNITVGTGTGRYVGGKVTVAINLAGNQAASIEGGLFKEID